MERVHKGGAKFDFEKAKWFNHEWIKKQPATAFSTQVLALFTAKGIEIPPSDLVREETGPDLTQILLTSSAIDPTGVSGLDVITPDPSLYTPASNRFEKILDLVKERCILLPDFIQQAGFFFQAPETIDVAAVKPKWNDAKQLFFAEFIRQLQLAKDWEAPALEANFKEMAAAAAIKPGDLLMPLRVMLVGAKFGPHVFDIAVLLGREETQRRIEHALRLLA